MPLFVMLYDTVVFAAKIFVPVPPITNPAYDVYGNVYAPFHKYPNVEVEV